MASGEMDISCSLSDFFQLLCCIQTAIAGYSVDLSFVKYRVVCYLSLMRTGKKSLEPTGHINAREV